MFRFRNHENDANPSTYVRGEYHEVQVEGGGHSLDGRHFFLPEGLTAQGFGDHLAIRFGFDRPPMSGPAPMLVQGRPGRQG